VALDLAERRAHAGDIARRPVSPRFSAYMASTSATSRARSREVLGFDSSDSAIPKQESAAYAAFVLSR
jgi:hypothetical protein